MDEILIECSPGISGDMLLAAFYDLGVPQTVFEKPFIKLGLKDLFFLFWLEGHILIINSFSWIFIKINLPRIEKRLSFKSNESSKSWVLLISE